MFVIFVNLVSQEARNLSIFQVFVHLLDLKEKKQDLEIDGDLISLR